MIATIFTHNGKFTVKSIKTGDHRTFRIRTQPANSKFAPGERVIALLTGSDNTSDYQPFGFVTDTDIHLFRNKRTETFLAYRKMLLKLGVHEAEGRVEVLAETTCRKCNRTLTTPESITSGIGPTCARRTI